MVFALHATGAATVRSPLAAPELLSVVRLILLLAKLFCSVVAPMPLLLPEPEPLLIVKSVGSSSQVPNLPWGALVSTRVPSAITRLAADVSTNPPSPPRLPPRALKAPPMSVRPDALLRSVITSMRPPWPALLGAASAAMRPVCSMRSLATRRTTPPSDTRPVALITPLFFTTPACRRLAAWADRMTRPPGASTALPLSTSAAMVAGVTRILDRPPSLPICNW